MANLARSIVKSAAHPYDKALLVESHLRRNYGYSLEMKGSPRTADPLAAFLFDAEGKAIASTSRPPWRNPPS